MIDNVGLRWFTRLIMCLHKKCWTEKARRDWTHSEQQVDNVHTGG